MTGKQLARKLAKLERAARNKVVRKGIREGAKIILKPARKAAPKRTGLTRKAIKTKVMKRKKDRIGLNVQIGKGEYKGETFYAAFVEFGTRRMKARPFLGPAYYKYRRKAMKVTERVMLEMFYSEMAKV
jgi:HK97 gp10 family phage protein